MTQPYPEEPPDPAGLEHLPSAPAAERNLVGALLYDPLTCAWQVSRDSSEAKNKERELDILSALEDLGKVPAHTIAKSLGKDYSNTHKVLSSLWTAGKIKKEIIEGKSIYFLPEDEKQ